MLNTSQPQILAQFTIFSLLFKIISNEINTLLNTFQPEIFIFLNTLSLSPKKVCVYKKENMYKNVEAQITLKFMEVVVILLLAMYISF